MSFKTSKLAATVYCLLFMVKKFCCFISLLSFLKKLSWLSAFTSFHIVFLFTGIHCQKDLPINFCDYKVIQKECETFNHE